MDSTHRPRRVKSIPTEGINGSAEILKEGTNIAEDFERLKAAMLGRESNKPDWKLN
jgi:hypothetical protein